MTAISWESGDLLLGLLLSPGPSLLLYPSPQNHRETSWLQITTSLPNIMDHESSRRGSYAQQYQHSIISLGPLSPPERTYSNESNSAMNTPIDSEYTTPWTLTEMQSPHTSVTASTPEDQTISEVVPNLDEKVSQALW